MTAKKFLMSRARLQVTICGPSQLRRQWRIYTALPEALRALRCLFTKPSGDHIGSRSALVS